MSRLWGERLRIGLSGTRVELARTALLGGRIRDEKRFNFRSASVRPVTEKILIALPRALEQFGAGRGQASVVISNDLVRYLMLPWQESASSPQEVREIARLQFEQVHGEAARGWTVQCHEGGWGRPTLACAIDTALIEGVKAVLDARQLRITTLQPLLMAGFNAVRSELAGDTALAIVEADRVCVGVLRDGHLTEVSSRHSRGDSATIASQELAMLGEAGVPPPVHVLLMGEHAQWQAAPEDDTHPTAPAAWRAVGAPLAESRCALAMVGAA